MIEIGAFAEPSGCLAILDGRRRGVAGLVRFHGLQSLRRNANRRPAPATADELASGVPGNREDPLARQIRTLDPDDWLFLHGDPSPAARCDHMVDRLNATRT